MKKQIINIAFLGFRHSHIFDIYNLAKENPRYNISGAFEQNEKAKKAAKEKGVVFTYSSLSQLLCDQNVDAVVLGCPFGERGKMAIEVLKAGKNVIADKPLCTSLGQLERIEGLAKEKNLLVSAMFSMRFDKKICAVKRLFESGKLGEIVSVYFGGQHPLQYGRRPEWYFEEENYGGVINDIAIHGIDALSFIFNLEIDNIIAARCWNKFAENEPNFKDCGQFMLKATNGAGILADVSYAIPDGVEFALPYYWQFYIWGTRGTIRFALNEEKSYYYVKGKKEAFLLQEYAPETNYLTDFYNLFNGKSAVLPMADVFNSTRKTLEIQTFSA